MSATTARLHERQLRALGIATRVLEGGPAGDSEALVLLHGNPGSAEDWALVQPRLAELARVIAFDLPGYGKADRPPDWDYSPMSYGGFIGAESAWRGGDRVAGPRLGDDDQKLGSKHVRSMVSGVATPRQ
jgi:hypothetical protein